MASPTQNQLSNADLFDAYFQRADLDRDGRISGAEAVSFFQGSGLPKQVLAQIWTIANQSQSGFLGRPEFYNALKLATVAQSKRDLTPEIVKAALYSPASAKIPVPQINFSAVPTPQNTASAAGPVRALSPVTSTSTPSLGFRGAEGPMTMSGGGMPVRPNVISTQQSQSMRPSQMQSASASSSISGVSAQGFEGVSAGRTAIIGQPQNVTAGPQSQVMRPSQTQSPSASASLSAPSASTQGFGGLSPAHGDWIGGKTTGVPARTPSQVQAGGINPSSNMDEFRPVTHGSISALWPETQSPSGLHPSVQGVKDSNTWGTSGNGISSDPTFGGDLFSVVPSKSTKDTSLHTSSARTLPSSTSGTAAPSSLAGTALPSTADTALPSSAAVMHHSIRPGVPVSLLSSFPSQPADALHQQSSTHASEIMPRSSGMSIGSQSLDASQPQRPWPKMTQADIQKYTKVFLEVDKDRDGKITGEQARNLFLSWRLPREVLKQVWDLSDQDNDSMLSLREFCIALYLMERHREGSPLPPALPSSIMFNLSNIGQPVAQHRSAAWEPASGFQQQQQQQWMPVSGARQLNPSVVGKPPRPPSISQSEEVPLTNQQKTKVPVLENLVNQLSSDEQDSLNSKLKEATEAAKKVEELEKEIMDSNEKMQFYRTKMQELVLYKSRCDNRLNEIIERISADKHEVESLAKKYEEKYKQTGDVASKLTAEEATFRDIQDKKMELYQSILKMENDGNTDGEIQASADRTQSALDELIKSMNERCKKYGLRTKPMTLVELPFGWQPGIQEGAADWDEDWDKFEDEGFSFVKELTLEVQNILAPPKEKLHSAKTDKTLTTETAVTASSPKSSDESEKLQSKEDREIENGCLHDKGEDASTRTAPSSPIARSADENQSSERPSSRVEKISTSDTILHDKESESIHTDPEAAFSGEKNHDDSNWGTFDANDDVDSVWGFNYASTGKEIAPERNGNNYFDDFGDFGLNPIKTGSYQTADFSQKKGGFTFDESVPSTPLSIFGNSPKRSSDFSEAAFDNFSRFDSFNKYDNGFFPSREASAKFDSVHSSKDYDYSHSFPSFDDSDPFGSGPFKTSFDSQTPRKT